MIDDELTKRSTEQTGPPVQQQEGAPQTTPVAGRDQRVWLRFAGLGIELATSTLLFAGIGYLVDWMLALPKSYATAAGTLVGFTIGMIRFIQQALKGTGNSVS